MCDEHPRGILAQVVEHLTFNQVVPGSSPGCLIRSMICKIIMRRELVLSPFMLDWMLCASGACSVSIGAERRCGSAEHETIRVTNVTCFVKDAKRGYMKDRWNRSTMKGLSK